MRRKDKQRVTLKVETMANMSSPWPYPCSSLYHLCLFPYKILCSNSLHLCLGSAKVLYLLFQISFGHVVYDPTHFDEHRKDFLGRYGEEAKYKIIS